jgi:hypothetical protein
VEGDAQKQYSGYRAGTLREGRDAFLGGLRQAGYTIVFSEVDPGDAEVDFNGGDVQFLQECRGRVRVILTLERAG